MRSAWIERIWLDPRRRITGVPPTGVNVPVEGGRLVGGPDPGGRFVVEVIPVCPNPRQRPHHLSMTVRGWAAWVEHYGARPVREEDEA